MFHFFLWFIYARDNGQLQTRQPATKWEDLIVLYKWVTFPTKAIFWLYKGKKFFEMFRDISIETFWGHWSQGLNAYFLQLHGAQISVVEPPQRAPPKICGSGWLIATHNTSLGRQQRWHSGYNYWVVRQTR